MRERTLEKERLLTQETRQKDDLITYLAHDLKTPLASVIGYLCLLDESPTPPDELREQYIGITLDKAYRLEQLINEFFDITRYNLHTIVVNPGKIHLRSMLLRRWPMNFSHPGAGGKIHPGQRSPGSGADRRCRQAGPGVQQHPEKCRCLQL
ncbi:MAG: sensor histidine kinase [Lachnospiraceae bacterium]